MFDFRYTDQYASFLIRLAWTVEIIAALIGLTISIIVGVSVGLSDQFEESLLGRGASVLVAGLPFLLVAVVELCKIPLTFAFIAVESTSWRLLFLFFVLFLCLITFETMFNGFERNFSNLNYAIDTYKNQIEDLDAEEELVQWRMDRVQTFTQEDLVQEIDQRQGEIDAVYAASVTSARNNAEKAVAGIDYSFRDEIPQEIEALMRRRDTYYEQWSVEREGIENRFSGLLLDNISDSRGEKERLLAERNALQAEMEDALAAANFLTRSTVENKYRTLISEKDQRIADITEGYLGGDAIVQQSQMEGQLKGQLAFTAAKYQGRIDDVNKLIEDQQALLMERDADVQSTLVGAEQTAQSSINRFFAVKKSNEQVLEAYSEERQAELDVIMQSVYVLEDKVLALRNAKRKAATKINHLINQNQIYRLAMYAYGTDRPSDVDRGMIGIVAFIWFGSLALIASVTGVMLALAGFYLRRNMRPDELAAIA
jgi:hypothetical protein